MFNINDSSLKNLQLTSLTWNEFKEDYENLMNEGGFYSDEISETDKKLIKKKIKEHIQSKNKNEVDKHILRIYDKL